jgi:hypothetical protein
VTELDRLRKEVALLEPMVKLIDRGLAPATTERHLARQVLAQLRNLRNDAPALTRVVRG